METLKKLEQLTMTAVDIGLENGDNLQEISDKLDTVLQQIRELEQEIQSHESLQDTSGNNGSHWDYGVKGSLV